ncbi:antibiotic biosynthesis monooxygenase [Rhodocytophaga rosea]|uniref:Antibiotic biosynthesis monooxygenase n=1 Tax=Rhodocytophaga rosea TaxID=2704465 RepID=A0A6C0GFQ5_9BACT|nr:antibiotic biosynthesis monooxygenase family protein [Rhodocytophaga rosea]QHT66695.1 antibiotic biosynthesis monooxygenase [Rhodocytophaga rosea]
MLIRIVRMHFQPDQVEAFLMIFEQSKSVICSFPGCLSVELLQDASDSSVYYTHSQWIDEEALEYYRQSLFFKETWAKTKILFANKAQAFSLKKL